MFHYVAEHFPPSTGAPLAFSASSPAARRAVEGSSHGYVLKGLRMHFETFRKDEEVSCHRCPTRTVCIHADALPPSFAYALWWIQRDGARVPVAFRAARLTGKLYYGVSAEEVAALVQEGKEELVAAPANVLSADEPPVRALVARTISLYLGGSRLREVWINPTLVARLERLDVSNCRCLKSLRWTKKPPPPVPTVEAKDAKKDRESEAPCLLQRLRVLKASFSGLTQFPADRLADWAPNLTTALLSGCRGLTQEQINGILEGSAQLRVARMDSTKLSSVEPFATTCPHLVELNVSTCPDLQGVEALGVLKQLRHLDLHGNVGLVSLKGVGACQSLRRLDVSHCKRLSSLTSLWEGGAEPGEDAAFSLKHLLSFNATSCVGLTDTNVNVLRHCLMLEEVRLNQCAVLSDLSALAHHTNLIALHAADTALCNLEFLRSCTALEQLSVAGCTRLLDVMPLKGLTRLMSVDACYTGVTHVAALVDACAALRVVLLRECYLDPASTQKLEACATRIATTHRGLRTADSAFGAAAAFSA